MDCLRARTFRESALRTRPFLRRHVAFDGREHARGLRAAHDADPRVRPHPQLPRRIGASAHPVVAGAEAAADHDRELRDFGAGDRHDELGAVFGDAAVFVLLADHEAGDVLQEEQRRAALRAELDEVRAFERALAEENAVVGEDADRMPLDARESADERRAVARFELVELRRVDEPRDDLADVVADAAVGRNDAVDVARVVLGRLRFGAVPLARQLEMQVARRSRGRSRAPARRRWRSGRRRPRCACARRRRRALRP